MNLDVHTTANGIFYASPSYGKGKLSMEEVEIGGGPSPLIQQQVTDNHLTELNSVLISRFSLTADFDGEKWTLSPSGEKQDAKPNRDHNTYQRRDRNDHARRDHEGRRL